MKVLLFSDLHAHAFKAHSTMDTNGRNSRLNHAINILTEIRELAVKRECSGVLFGGDLFHIRPGLGSMNISTFNQVFNAIANIKARVDFVGLLVGNHDQGNRSGTDHSIFSFNSIVTVMESPGWQTFFSKQGEEFDVFALPAHADKDFLIYSLNTLHEEFKTGIPNILLGHLAIDGALVSDSFALKNERALKVSDLKPDWFDQVFLGDYHVPQKLAENVHYIGATHQHNWGDSGSSRGCIIYDTENKAFTREPLKSAPLFITVEYEKYDTDKGYKKDKLESLEGNFVRVLHEEPIPLSTKEAIRKEIEKKKPASSVEFWLKNIPATDIKKTENVKFHPALDMASMVRNFVDTADIGDLDEEYLLNVGESLMNKALGTLDDL